MNNNGTITEMNDVLEILRSTKRYACLTTKTKKETILVT